MRVIRACTELGVRSIAVFSEADRLAPHVLEADEAYLLGPAPSSESYLRTDRILEIAKRARVQAVHPGYGFLSEQAAFAQAVADAGLTFVGPDITTIATMGSKTQARRRMQDIGIPMVPGATETVEDPEAALRMA
ncbi:MAG: biotin carboxylase N-terminal domain-containing protein, partial [Longimicrobiales bacterium]